MDIKDLHATSIMMCSYKDINVNCGTWIFISRIIFLV